MKTCPGRVMSTRAQGGEGRRDDKEHRVRLHAEVGGKAAWITLPNLIAHVVVEWVAISFLSAFISCCRVALKIFLSRAVGRTAKCGRKVLA